MNQCQVNKVKFSAGICSGKHEVFENCTNPICRPKSCCQLGFPLNCTEPPKCNKGCVCKEGYVRNSKGICIPIKECRKYLKTAGSLRYLPTQTIQATENYECNLK